MFKATFEIIGRLKDAPEMLIAQGGSEYSRMTVVSEETFMAQNEVKKVPHFHNLICFKPNLMNYLRKFQKGGYVIVRGVIKQKEYTDNNGQRQYATNLEITEAQYLGFMSNTRQDGQQQTHQQNNQQQYNNGNYANQGQQHQPQNNQGGYANHGQQQQPQNQNRGYANSNPPRQNNQDGSSTYNRQPQQNNQAPQPHAQPQHQNAGYGHQNNGGFVDHNPPMDDVNFMDNGFMDSMYPDTPPSM